VVATGGSGALASLVGVAKALEDSGTMGPKTYPEMPVAHAIRMAVSMPLLMKPVVHGGLSWCDGGIVDIFPVRPVLDIEPSVDIAIAVNCY
jgi:NTE family protein